MEKTPRSKKLTLSRETVRLLGDPELGRVAGGTTLTYEGSCGPTLCPCPSAQSDCCVLL